MIDEQLRIHEQVRQIVSDVFTIPLEKVNAQSSPDTVEAWDSIRHLSLVLAVEEQFNLQFSPEEIEQMGSVEETARLIESKLGPKRS